MLDSLKPDRLFEEAISVQREVYPLTCAQMSIYYQCHYNPEGKMYDNPFIIRLDGNVDLRRLEAAWQKVLDNHAAFRAELVRDGNGLPGFVLRDRTIAGNPLLSYSLTRKAFSVNFHHLIFDGASFGIMLRELGKAYDGEELEPEAVNPLALGIYEQLLKDSESYVHGRQFYRALFEGRDCDTMLPYELPETNADDIPCGETAICISGEEKENIENFISGKGITAANLFMWAFQRTLSEAVHKRGVYFCTGCHGRGNAQLHNAVGMMVRTLSLYLETDPDRHIGVQLQEVDAVLHNAIEASDYPYASVADDCGLEYRCSFVYQGDDNSRLVLGGRSYPVEVQASGSAQADLVAMVIKYPDHYRIRLQYRSDCYRHETIAGFAEKFKYHCVTLK